MAASRITNSAKKDFTFIQIKITILDLGKVMPHMDLESLGIIKEFFTLDNGSMMNKTALDNSIGLMVPYLEAFFKEVIRKEVNFLGLITATMKDNLYMISLKAKVIFSGKTAELIRDAGKQTKCMALEYLSGLTGKFFLENT